MVTRFPFSAESRSSIAPAIVCRPSTAQTGSTFVIASSPVDGIERSSLARVGDGAIGVRRAEA